MAAYAEQLSQNTLSEFTTTKQVNPTKCLTILTEKWAPILSHQDLPEITDPYRKQVTAQLLENQESFLREQAAMQGSGSGLLLTEAPTMSVNAQGYQGLTGGSVNG